MCCDRLCKNGFIADPNSTYWKTVTWLVNLVLLWNLVLIIIPLTYHYMIWGDSLKTWGNMNHQSWEFGKAIDPFNFSSQSHMWPNLGKSTILSCMKQLEALCLTWYCHKHRMLFEYFWDPPYNFMYLECIQPTIA